MKGLVIIGVALVAVGLAELWYINRAIDTNVQQSVAQTCPVWLQDSPQEGCRGR